MFTLLSKDIFQIEFVYTLVVFWYVWVVLHLTILDDALVWQMLTGAAPCIILHQTRIKCWNAETMFRAEQGPCAPNKGLCKQIQRESQRENLCGSLWLSVALCGSLWLSLWLSLVLSLALCLSGALSLALSLSLYCTLHTFALCIILHSAKLCTTLLILSWCRHT